MTIHSHPTSTTLSCVTYPSMHLLRLATTVFLSLGLTACGDDGDTSNERSAGTATGGQGSNDTGASQGGESSADGCMPAPTTTLVGSWFVAVGLASNSGSPLVLRLDIDEDLEFTVQFLDAKDWLTPVGESIRGAGVVNAPQVLVDLPRTRLAGEANPTLYGTPFDLELRLEGALCIENALTGLGVGEVCGTGSGMIYEPLEQSLDDTTFRSHAQYPSAPIPEKVRVDCAGTTVSLP